MDAKGMAALCIRLFPEADIMWGAEHLEKNPEFAMQVTAVHCIASNTLSGPDYEIFRTVVIGKHLMAVQRARDARKESEERAKLESIRASIRLKKSSARKGRPGSHSLTPEEMAVDAIGLKG
jgi:hypothetical protein